MPKGGQYGTAQSTVRVCAMVDVIEDLRERFDYAAYFYASAWEHDPDMRIEGNVIVREESDFEEMMIATFDALSETLDAVPNELASSIEALRDQIGSEQYDRIVVESIQAIGPQSLPKDAAEFVETLNRSLQSSAHLGRPEQHC